MKGRNFSMRSYLKAKNSLNEANFLTVSGVSVIIKDPIEFELETEEFKETIQGLPRHFLSDIDYIIFGNFDFLSRKGYAASYKDGAIYVNNRQEDNASVYDDIVHEIGHSVEERYSKFIYSDMQLKKEFVKKRELLQKEFRLSGLGMPESKVEKSEYDEELDRYFSDIVGYPVMTSISQGIFYSPYGATCLREYFANGFEAYFYHRDYYLKKISPVLYDKLEKLEIGERK